MAAWGNVGKQDDSCCAIPILGVAITNRVVTVNGVAGAINRSALAVDSRNCDAAGRWRGQSIGKGERRLLAGDDIHILRIGNIIAIRRLGLLNVVTARGHTVNQDIARRVIPIVVVAVADGVDAIDGIAGAIQWTILILRINEMLPVSGTGVFQPKARR